MSSIYFLLSHCCLEIMIVYIAVHEAKNIEIEHCDTSALVHSQC